VIYLNEKVPNKINSIEFSDLYIVTDFDRTITVGPSSASWSILAKSNLVAKEYAIERQELYDYYRPIEIDLSLDFETKSKLMIEWWEKHLELFIKYQIPEEIINTAAKDFSVMDFRSGAKEFLEKMHDRNVPVIIISAGIGNFIQQFLTNNNCYFDNIYIVSNFIKFKNGIAAGMEKNIIHALNKNEVSLPKKITDKTAEYNKIILLGDSLADIKMVSDDKRNNTIRVGFLEENVEQSLESFKNEFDIVCTNNTSFNELSKVLNFDNK